MLVSEKGVFKKGPNKNILPVFKGDINKIQLSKTQLQASERKQGTPKKTKQAEQREAQGPYRHKRAEVIGRGRPIRNKCRQSRGKHKTKK